jgi:beta-glucosidase
MITFPKDFLWGAATSSYQVEGNNSNADWWQWERKAGKERSGAACRHYELYKKDFDLARGLHHNCHRLSIEWSRVEPKEGKFSRKELKHYLDVILALRKRNIEPMVTLHHFTNPIWLARSGGWENKRCVERFLRYCDVVIRALAEHVHYWVTINEPTIYISHSYLFGAWPPQAQSLLKAAAVEENMFSAHIRAFRQIHNSYEELKLPAPAIGIAQNVMAFVPCTPELKNRFAASLRDKVYNLAFLDRIMQHKAMDFVGINYYSRQLVELKSWGISNLATDVCRDNHHPVKKNSLGWDIYPKGLYDLLLELKQYDLPVIITENGICTLDDDLRWEYLSGHLKNIHRAMKKGVRVKGYLYWSLMDNFEWDKGFAPRFGLIGIDYKTYKRTVRKSARKFARVCKSGVLKE